MRDPFRIPKKGEGSGPDREGGGSPGLPMQDLDDKSLSHTSPPRRDPRRDRWAPVDSTGTRPPSSPTPRIGTSPSGWSRPHSVTRSSRSVHIQSTFSHFQSNFSHMWIHIQSTWGSTYVDPLRGFPCPGTPGNLWRSTPDGGNHGGDQLVTDGRSPRLYSMTNHRVTASWKASDLEKDSVFRT
jgi:hypothetical protein